MNKEKTLSLFKKLNHNTEDDKDGKNYRYFHPLRVWETVKLIIKKEKIAYKIDLDVVFVLSLFHDLGRNEKLIKENKLINSKDDFDKNNLALFKKYILPLIDGQNKKELLKKVVSDFSAKTYELLESKIVRDADNLDEVGILNFWRMAVYAGKHRQDVKEIADYYYNFDQGDKVKKMKKLFLPCSKKIAKERIKEMDKIMETFKRINGV
ncbi:MAG: HD domain-containing protein [Patescibacteria group bacterium]|nr:HD domain-containing protein [Patescibacteria group bacterium]